MSTAPVPVEYRCEVLATGPVYGRDFEVPYLLAAFQAISPVLALRWLRAQALHIADRLDPDPQRSPWVRPAMRLDPAPDPDCPTKLRFWCTSRAVQRAAHEWIESGVPLLVVVPDVECRFTLSVWPVRMPPSHELAPRKEPTYDNAHRTARRILARRNPVA
ncbi:hypothetical protein [Streptomyces graminilatus]|uniref:hypothetical protein n=1 Tax=Streptomyces graminilatus TaxID=1464070 RepID=UPI000AB9F7D6|nr:hypothetical protein [Streptomyces graminilatus]